ncbi:ion transporter [Glaciecola sp. 33A]|nr:ion transporter [Glaciecola sp. 33A]
MATMDLKKTLKTLYTGRSHRATGFRYGLISFDVMSILFFVMTAAIPLGPAILLTDILIGLVILADFSARLWIAPNRWHMLRQIYTIADIIVIFSLIFAPLINESFAFLRVLRTLRLLYSYHVIRELRSENVFFRTHETIILGIVNLMVFIFVMTALVFALQHNSNPLIVTYIDALYFTVSTLTTTGFGDVTLPGTQGKLLSVFIMVIGVALFLRLVTAIFRPAKVRYICPECGLNQHEPDAVHCKHCGESLKIETEGSQ